jgi:hypothetical protein
VLAAAVASVGCAAFTSATPASQKLDPRRAYLYGRFFIKSEDRSGDIGDYQTMGLQIRCVDGQTYTIRFIDKRDVQVIDVRPNACALDKVVYTAQSGIVLRQIAAPAEWRHTDVFAAGRAYYLGDYFAKADFWTRPRASWNELHWSWLMDPADDRFESTTAEMKQTFAGLSGLPTEDRRFAPKRPPPRGAVAGPPLSPERIARIAPLTKRSYATPAECERACPTGQCLPYRADTGPAVTCITGCKTDKDCPEGLACNCPDGPDCHAIAETPADPMAGICLSVEPAGERR